MFSSIADMKIYLLVLRIRLDLIEGKMRIYLFTQ